MKLLDVFVTVPLLVCGVDDHKVHLFVLQEGQVRSMISVLCSLYFHKKTLMRWGQFYGSLRVISHTCSFLWRGKGQRIA